MFLLWTEAGGLGSRNWPGPRSERKYSVGPVCGLATSAPPRFGFIESHPGYSGSGGQQLAARGHNVAELREDGVAEPHAARHVHGRVRLLGGLRGFPDVHLARAAYGTRVTTPRRQGRHRAAARQMSGRRTGQVPGIPVAWDSNGGRRPERPPLVMLFWM